MAVLQGKDKASLFVSQGQCNNKHILCLIVKHLSVQLLHSVNGDRIHKMSTLDLGKAVLQVQGVLHVT